MTATERAKRSDALYYETVSVNRRVLCDMIANRESDLEDALAENAALLEECDGWKKLCVHQEVMHVMHENALDNENAKLREEIEAAKHDLQVFSMGSVQLEAENAKLREWLRELVRDYEHCSVHADCGRCEYDGKLSTHCPLSPCFPDADELRELGVEVDE